MSDESRSPSISDRFSFDSLTLRTVLVGILVLLMLIPLGFVSSIVNERGYRYNSVLQDIANTWGEPQTLVAPVLNIPYTDIEPIQETIIDPQGNSRLIDKNVRRHRTALFLPQSLAIQGNLIDQWRERGIFRSLVYTAELNLQATFPELDVSTLSDNIETIHWDKAWLSMGLSDTRAINNVNVFSWNNAALTLQPGTQQPLLPGGFHAELPELDTGFTHTLDIQMSLRGSGYFQFAPLGEKTTVELESSWPHPSFQGRTLPETRRIDEEGFSARWVIPHLARNYPQAFRNDATHNLSGFTAGVSMFEPVSLYSRIERSVKYGVLFIGLTFITLLVFEFAIQRRLHVVQYGLIGFALSLFYLVLLSLSEHMNFSGAYLVAATLTIGMIAGYTWSVLGSGSKAFLVLSMLAALYTVLFSLLHLEDFALVLGTALLTVVLVALMWATRKLHRDVSVPAEQI